MTVYTAMRQRAAASIQDKGAAVTVTYRTAGAYDPATGTSAITTATEDGYGVVLPFSTGLRKMAGTNIQMGDMQLLLATLAADGEALTAPNVDDTVLIGSKTYTIIDIAPLAPDGTDLLYTCTIRGTE
ncbi:hypothetical protein BSL82_01275 [Tardibacter chloracetimidivorans]|uniref:Phage tail protein n=1 Tax=Tardibacter chloracetimidivorans TaxID=1921510 RepID=A0A1L3ZR45_9SPHN|nr:hypothetical protein [Tardibacter chloracetimidivorans]API58095.1 hypothetical protein BSL82_01275 [Tardibacter chloracetimidivorans]